MNNPGMPANITPEPIPVYRFKVYVQALCMGFSKITNIEESIEIEPLQEGGVNDRVHVLQRPTAQEKTLVMERGVASRGMLGKTLAPQFAIGKRITTGLFITLLGRDGSLQKVFEVHGAVVKKLSYSSLDASSSELFIETFELAYEKMQTHK